MMEVTETTNMPNETKRVTQAGYIAMQLILLHYSISLNQDYIEVTL